MNKASVGILVCKNTDRFLLLLRPKDDKTIRDKWTFVAGTIDKGEDPLDTIKREVEEELKFNSSDIEFEYIGKVKDKNIDLYYFIGLMENEDEPTLNGENVDWNWFSLDSLPDNTFSKCRKMLNTLYQNGRN